MVLCYYLLMMWEGKKDNMKKNNKGFTLIELLAVIIILGVLLLIAIPAVSKYIERTRIRTYKTNLSKMVDAVSIEVNSYSDEYQFNSTQYLVVPFVCIDLERGSNDKSPFSAYDASKSYVIVTRDANGFDYKVAALDLTGYGTDGITTAEDATIKVKPTTVPAITKEGSGYKMGTGVTGVEGTASIVTCDALTNAIK